MARHFTKYPSNYVKASLEEQLWYARQNEIYEVYDEYKNKPIKSLESVWNEIAKKYGSSIADGVCEMLDMYDGE